MIISCDEKLYVCEGVGHLTGSVLRSDADRLEEETDFDDKVVSIRPKTWRSVCR